MSLTPISTNFSSSLSECTQKIKMTFYSLVKKENTTEYDVVKVALLGICAGSLVFLGVKRISDPGALQLEMEKSVALYSYYSKISDEQALNEVHPYIFAYNQVAAQALAYKEAYQRTTSWRFF